MWVKLKPGNAYQRVTVGRYYEVLDEYFDPVDKEYTYLIKDDRFEKGYYSQSDFEEPVTHVKCVDNTGQGNSLTCLKDYEIISIRYVGAGVVTIEDDNAYVETYSFERFEFINKEKPVEHKGYTHVICKNNDGQYRALTYGKKYEIIEANNSMVKIVDDVNEYGWYAESRFEFVTEDTPEILFKPDEAISFTLEGNSEELEPLPQNIYHITYSIQYAAGAELVDISKKNILGIDGEIVSKGTTWVIETEKGTVIIPFKAIIHMYPKTEE